MRLLGNLLLVHPHFTLGGGAFARYFFYERLAKEEMESKKHLNKKNISNAAMSKGHKPKTFIGVGGSAFLFGHHLDNLPV